MLQVGPRSAGARSRPDRLSARWRRADRHRRKRRARPHRSREPRSGGPGASLDIAAARKAMGDLGDKLGLGLLRDGGGNHRDRQSAHGWTYSTAVNRTRARSARFRARRIRRRRPAARRGVDSRSRHRHDAGAAIPGRACAPWAARSPTCGTTFSQTLERAGSTRSSPDRSAAILEAQAEKGKAQLKANNLSIEGISVSHVADMSYTGQIHSLRVPIQRDWPAARMREAFLQAYVRNLAIRSEKSRS